METAQITIELNGIDATFELTFERIPAEPPVYSIDPLKAHPGCPELLEPLTLHYLSNGHKIEASWFLDYHLDELMGALPDKQ